MPRDSSLRIPPLWTPTENTSRLGRAVDYTLEGFRLVLETVQSTPGMSAVPALNEAAAIALRILTVVQDVKSRNQAFNDLARDACGLVYTIVLECQSMVRDGRNVPERVQIHVASLARNLSDIEQFARRKVERSTFKKIVFHSKDLEEIARYRQLLRQSLDVFGIQTNISVQENLSRITDNIEKYNQELKANRDKYEEEQRRTAQELASRVEVLRIQEEDRRAEVEEDIEFRQKTEQKEAKKRRRKDERMKKDTEKWEESEQEGTYPSRPHSSPQPDTEYYVRPGRTPSPQPYNISPYVYLSPSPYLYSGYPTSPYIPPSPIPQMSSITGSAISFSGAPAHVTNYNSGNISNSFITNSMNSSHRRKKSPGTNGSQQGK